MTTEVQKSEGVGAVAMRLLEEGKPAEAAEVLRRRGLDSPDLRDLYGVCLMRTGQMDKAVELYRDLVLQSGSVCLKPGTPGRFIINYATALLLANNVSGCLAILHEAGGPDDPSVSGLRTAIKRWRKSLNWWERIRLAFGGELANRPVLLDSAPGDISRRNLRPAA